MQFFRRAKMIGLCEALDGTFLAQEVCRNSMVPGTVANYVFVQFKKLNRNIPKYTQSRDIRIQGDM